MVINNEIPEKAFLIFDAIRTAENIDELKSLESLIMDRKKFSKRFKKYEPCVDDFIKAIENSSSPKEVDIYTSYVEAEQEQISDLQKEKLFSEKMSVLHTLINYAEKSKLNFNRKLETSGTLQIISTVFTVISDFLSTTSFIPGVNLLVTRGTSTACDFLAYATLTASNATNLGVSKSRKQAELRHYEALKRYAIAEATTGGVGTLALTVGLAVGASAASAAVPLLAPAFLMAGAGVMMVNNIISSMSTYKELKRAETVLKELKIELRGSTAVDLSEIQKKSLERAELRVRTLKAQLKAKGGTALGSALVAVLAAGALVAALGFPPLGGGLALAFTMMAMGATIYSTFQKYKERSLAKATYKLSAEIEKEERTGIIHTLKNERKIEVKPPSPEATAEVKTREKNKVERAKPLTFHGEEPIPPQKKETNAETKTWVPPHPTPGKHGNGKK